MTTESTRHLPESALFTGRGTTALWALLQCLQGRGVSVLLPVNICEIVIPAIRHAGFQPLFHDVDPVSGNATVENLRQAWRPGVAACLATHNFGTPLDMDAIKAWAREQEVFLIEDACNALGATWNGAPVGSFGDAAIFSFGHAKIVEVGAGGALQVRDAALRRKARGLLDSLPLFSPRHQEADAAFQAVLRTLRQNPPAARPEVYRALYAAYLPHLLFRPDGRLQEAIARNLEGLDRNLAERREKARLWRSLLDVPPLRQRPEVAGDVYWRYTFLAPETVRDRLLAALRAKGIPASTWFPPVDRLFDGRRASAGFPNAARFAGQCLNVFVDRSMELAAIPAAAALIRKTLEQA